MGNGTTGISGVGNNFPAQGIGTTSSVQTKLGETLRTVQTTSPTVSLERLPGHGMASASGSKPRTVSKYLLSHRARVAFGGVTAGATARSGRTETMTKIWEGRLKEAHKNFSKARNEAESYRAKGQNDVADLCLHRAKEKFFKVDQGARNYMRTPDFKSSGTTAGATARKTASPAVLGGTGGSGKMPPSQAMNLGELVGKTGVSVPLPASPSAAASDPKEMVEIWEGKLEKARESFSKEVNKAKDYAVRGHGPLARNLLRKAEKEFSEAIQGVRAYMKMPVFEGLERSTRLSFRRQTLTAEVLMQTTMKEVEVEIEVRKGHR